MAEFSMWGPQQSGMRLAEKDFVEQQVNQLAMMKTAGEIQQQPFDLQNKMATARLHNAEAGAKEYELAATQKWAQSLSSMGATGTAEDPLAWMEGAGLAAVQSGLPEKGTKLMNMASQMRARQATERFNDARGARYEALTIKDHAERAGNLFSTVIDQASHDRAMMQALSEGIDVSQIPQDFEQARPLLKQITDASVDVAKRAELTLHEIDTTSRLNTKEEEKRRNKVRDALDKARTALAEERIARLKQAGVTGPAVGKATKDDRSAVGALLKEAGISMDADQLTLAKQGIASRAKEMVRENRALGMDQALRRALAEAQKNGDITPSSPGLFGTQLGGGKSKFLGGGRTPLTPLPFPFQPGQKPDPSKMVVGRYYQGPAGIGKWTGKAMSMVGGADTPDGIGDDEEDDE